MVALHPTTTANVDPWKHMDLHLCDSSRGSWMHIPFCRLAHAHTHTDMNIAACWRSSPGQIWRFAAGMLLPHAHADDSNVNVIVGLAGPSTRRQLEIRAVKKFKNSS